MYYITNTNIIQAFFEIVLKNLTEINGKGSAACIPMTKVRGFTPPLGKQNHFD